MSISKQYTKKGRSSLLGSPVGTFVEELVISDLDSVFDEVIIDEFSIGAKVVSCQVFASSLTGTLDGTVQLLQSNNGVTWDVIPGITGNLSGSSLSFTLEKEDFSGIYLGARITKNSITGGKVSLSFVVKHH